MTLSAARFRPVSGSPPASNALEHLLQAVREVVGVPGQVALGQQGVDLLVRQAVPGTNGSMAGQQAEKVVEELLPLGALSRLTR